MSDQLAGKKRCWKTDDCWRCGVHQILQHALHKAGSKHSSGCLGRTHVPLKSLISTMVVSDDDAYEALDCQQDTPILGSPIYSLHDDALQLEYSSALDLGLHHTRSPRPVIGRSRHPNDRCAQGCQARGSYLVYDKEVIEGLRQPRRRRPARYPWILV